MEQRERIEKLDMWGIVEVMGHKRYAGHISEQALGSASLIRVDVPETVQPGGVTTKPYSKLVGVSSVYCITPTTEHIARRAAEQIERWNEPIPVDLPERRQIAAISSAEYGEARARHADLETGSDDDVDDDEYDDDDLPFEVEAQPESGREPSEIAENDTARDTENAVD